MHTPILSEPPQVTLRSLRILLGVKHACDADVRTIRKIEDWSLTKEGMAAFGEPLSRDTIVQALIEIEKYVHLPVGTLFARHVNAKRRQTLRPDDAMTVKAIVWAQRVLATVNGSAKHALQAAAENVSSPTLTISSENYLAVAVLPEVIKRFNDERLERGKNAVRFVIHELSSLDAAKHDHRRAKTDFIIHSVRAARKGVRQTWTAEDGLELIERKVAGIKIENAIQLPDLAFIPRTPEFAQLWNRSVIWSQLNPLLRPALRLSELEDHAVAIVGTADDDAFRKEIPGLATPRVLVDSMAAAIRLVETERYVGIMNAYGLRLLRDDKNVVVRPIESSRPACYIRAYCRNQDRLSLEANEFLNALFAWLFEDSPGPKPTQHSRPVKTTKQK